MKGGERHSSLLTLRSSLNWWRQEESNLPSAEFYLAVITMRPAPICLRFAGNVARHVPVFPGCHPRAFCAERNKHPLLNVVSFIPFSSPRSLFLVSILLHTHRLLHR